MRLLVLAVLVSGCSFTSHDECKDRCAARNEAVSFYDSPLPFTSICRCDTVEAVERARPAKTCADCVKKCEPLPLARCSVSESFLGMRAECVCQEATP